MTTEEKNLELQEQIKKIKKCLKEQSIEEMALYDVKNELVKILEIGEGDSPLKRMAIYRDKIDNKNYKIDCDVALRTAVIYTLAFPFVSKEGVITAQSGTPKKYQINNKEHVIIGDTMNSYKTTVHEYYRRYGNCGRNKELLVRNNKGKNAGKLRTPEKYATWPEYILDNKYFLDFEDMLSDVAKEFIEINHTIGNFIPVPKAFNFPRSKTTLDYWDLTLQKIYQWYQSGEKGKRNNTHLKNLVGEENVDPCVKWLEIFNDWAEFIEQNYLQDFVRRELKWHNGKIIEEKYMEPIIFWEGHSFDKILPDEKGEFMKFFTNVTSMIKLRGLRISKKVKLAIVEE